MNEQIKTPKGIKIIAGLMFVMGLILIALQVKFFCGAISFIIFANSIFIIASVGLWKKKNGDCLLL